MTARGCISAPFNNKKITIIMKQILNYIESQLETLDKGIIATPTSEKYLKAFAETNNGQNDMLLVEFAKKLGYKNALLDIKKSIEFINTINK